MSRQQGVAAAMRREETARLLLTTRSYVPQCDDDVLIHNGLLSNGRRRSNYQHIDRLFLRYIDPLIMVSLSIDKATPTAKLISAFMYGRYLGDLLE